MAIENMASSPFDCVKKSEQITPKNSSIVVRDYLHEDSTLWSVQERRLFSYRSLPFRVFQQQMGTMVHDGGKYDQIMV
uniref:Uncharacterized protein n=1 Tax=Ditylenchus dipsaci TaxID=166011 RepID=A0A915DPV6_9BILA